MLQIFVNPNYDFIGKRRWAYLISLAFISLGVGSMVLKGGLHYGIDFSGGTLIQVRFEKPVAIDAIRGTLDRIRLGESVIQEFGDPREFLIRVASSGAEVARSVQDALTREAALGPVEIRRVEFVGPQVGKDLQLQAVYAVGLGVAGILIYIAFRFDIRGGIAAILAIFHDVLVSLGALSLTNREMSLPVLAALLTIIGYSVNDTIVAYDRLRENRGKALKRGAPLAELMNGAINQTLSRTVLTALTVFMSTTVLFFFGGKVLEDFAFALTIGVITGTYSTIYIAGSVIVDWDLWARGRAQAKKVMAKA
ncbi:MAG: protein translocase subunit SecF [Candidatus Rokubacteria bacterium]|nr:protein translocase subunit SecF [Candidatus Rokubacteria bacterium]